MRGIFRSIFTGLEELVGSAVLFWCLCCSALSLLVFWLIVRLLLSVALPFKAALTEHDVAVRQTDVGESGENDSALVLYHADLDLCGMVVPKSSNLSLQPCNNPAQWQMVRGHHIRTVAYVQHIRLGSATRSAPPDIAAELFEGGCGRVTMQDCEISPTSA